jgi:hypothetical protein
VILSSVDEEKRVMLAESIFCPFFDEGSDGYAILFDHKSMLALRECKIDSADLPKGFTFGSLCVETLFYNQRLRV